MTDLKSSAI